MRQAVPHEQLLVRRTGVGHRHEPPDASDIVVAEERRQLIHIRVGVGVEVVVLEEALEPSGGAGVGGEVLCARLESEVQDRLHLGTSGVARSEGLDLQIEDLAEHEELLKTLPTGELEHFGAKLLPELVVDVLHGVDAEAIDPEIPYPGLVDVDHALNHPRVLREKVIEASEVTVERILGTGERRVSAVVVERHIVEPLRHLARQLFGDERVVWEARLWVERREAVRAGEVAGIRQNLHVSCPTRKVRPVRRRVGLYSDRRASRIASTRFSAFYRQ